MTAPNLNGLNGQQIAALVEAHAARHGLCVADLMRPLCHGRGGRWHLEKLRRVKVPRSETRRQLAAVLAAPPGPRPAIGPFAAAGRNRDDSHPPPRRDPCFKCGTRGDIGCAHQPLELAV